LRFTFIDIFPCIILSVSNKKHNREREREVDSFIQSQYSKIECSKVIVSNILDFATSIVELALPHITRINLRLLLDSNIFYLDWLTLVHRSIVLNKHWFFLKIGIIILLLSYRFLIQLLHLRCIIHRLLLLELLIR